MTKVPTSPARRSHPPGRSRGAAARGRPRRGMQGSFSWSISDGPGLSPTSPESSALRTLLFVLSSSAECEPFPELASLGQDLLLVGEDLALIGDDLALVAQDLLLV